MKYIANVVTSYKSKKYGSFIRVTDNILDLDLNIPTLIIGYDRSKSFCNDTNRNINCIDRKINNNVYWTFEFNEKKAIHDTDIANFLKIVKNEVEKQIDYKFFNILTAKKSKILSFVRFLFNDIKKYYYITNNMLYISYDNIVIGVSLDDCEYIGINKNKIINKLNKNFKEYICEDNNFLKDTDVKLFGNNDIMCSALYCYSHS